MSDSVTLKSNKYGLTLILSPTEDFEKLVRDVCEKFAKSADFFGETEMILETIGRDLSAEEGNIIIQAIELNSRIKIVLLHENNQLKDVRMQEKKDRFYSDNIFENAKIIRGSITKEDTIDSDSSIIILGDVKSHASVTASGNVIVLGSLDGSVHAGYPDNTGCYIVAGQLNSNDLTIGTITGNVKVQDKWSLRVKKATDSATGVTVFNGELLAEPISSGLLKRIKR